MSSELSNYDNTSIDQSHLGDGVVGDGGDAPDNGLSVHNDSKLKRMFWIGFYTTLLSVVTLTVFRFWGRTDFRKQLWSDTKVGGEPLEYTGKAMELFIGFVIAIFTFMLPYLGILYFGQTLLSPEIFGLVIFFVYMLLFVIMGVAIFLARRYHLSRTRLRGIRFAQTGSAWGYGFTAFGYGIVTSLTLGWFAPAARINLSKKMWQDAYFGNQKFSFTESPETKKEPVYLSFAVAWVGGILLYVGLMSFIVGVAMQNVSDGEFDPATFESTSFILQLYGIIFVGALIFSLFVAWHQAVMIRYIMKCLSVGGVSLSNSIKTRDILELAITNSLMIVFTLGFGIMPAQMRMWKRIANATSIIGDINFAEIEQSADQGPKQGEGLADGLDLTGQF